MEFINYNISKHWMPLLRIFLKEQSFRNFQEISSHIEANI